MRKTIALAFCISLAAVSCSRDNGLDANDIGAEEATTESRRVEPPAKVEPSNKEVSAQEEMVSPDDKHPDTIETAQQEKAIESSEPAIPGAPAVFEGEQSWQFNVTFQPGGRITGDVVDDLVKGYEKLPALGNFRCAVSYDAASRPVEVRSNNDIWLEGDGETVRMKRFALWKEGDRSAHFKLHYTDGQTVVSGDFSGQFGANGEVEGTFEGQFILLRISAGPDGKPLWSLVGAWNVANGRFSLSPAPQEANPNP